ncbi:MAG: flagellar hook-length control protein FliK [Alphaproteobacteria bacterium]|nr:flagellar hook-length control protein FliK [Alphaproteobacteria bacterium]
MSNQEQTNIQVTAQKAPMATLRLVRTAEIADSGFAALLSVRDADSPKAEKIQVKTAQIVKEKKQAPPTIKIERSKRAQGEEQTQAERPAQKEAPEIRKEPVFTLEIPLQDFSLEERQTPQMPLIEFSDEQPERLDAPAPAAPAAPAPPLLQEQEAPAAIDAPRAATPVMPETLQPVSFEPVKDLSQDMPALPKAEAPAPTPKIEKIAVDVVQIAPVEDGVEAQPPVVEIKEKNKAESAAPFVQAQPKSEEVISKETAQASPANEVLWRARPARQKEDSEKTPLMEQDEKSQSVFAPNQNPRGQQAKAAISAPAPREGQSEPSSLVQGQNLSVLAQAARGPLGLDFVAQAQMASAAQTAGSAQQVVQQVVVQLTRAVKDGTQDMLIRLKPPELGKIEIKLSFGPDKAVTATVLADNQSTLQLLLRDAQQLARALSDAGLEADAGSLQFGLRDEGGEAFAGRQGFDGQEPAHEGMQDKAVFESAAASETYILTPGRVNIHV